MTAEEKKKRKLIFVEGARVKANKPGRPHLAEMYNWPDTEATIIEVDCFNSSRHKNGVHTVEPSIVLTLDVPIKGYGAFRRRIDPTSKDSPTETFGQMDLEDVELVC